MIREIVEQRRRQFATDSVLAERTIQLDACEEQREQDSLKLQKDWANIEEQYLRKDTAWAKKDTIHQQENKKLKRQRNWAIGGGASSNLLLLLLLLLVLL